MGGLRLPTSKRDRVYVTLSAAVLLMTLVNVPGIVDTVRTQQEKYDDAVQFRDLWISVAIGAMFFLVRRALESPFSVLGNLVVARKPAWSPEYRQKKVARFCEQLYKLMFVVAISAFEWYLLNDQPFCPATLGGSGDMALAWRERPGTPPLRFRALYWIALAYNLEDFFTHTLLVDPRSDYYEIIFHHVMAIALILISYFANHWRGGVAVLVVHNIPDICVHSVKCSVDGANVPRTLAIYIAMLITWAYFRLFVFPVDIVFTAFLARDVEHVKIMVAMGVGLFALHVHWFSLFIDMGLSFLRTGKAEDTQQKMIDSRKGRS